MLIAHEKGDFNSNGSTYEAVEMCNLGEKLKMRRNRPCSFELELKRHEMVMGYNQKGSRVAGVGSVTHGTICKWLTKANTRRRTARSWLF